jgi:hypothetical protein
MHLDNKGAAEEEKGHWSANWLRLPADAAEDETRREIAEALVLAIIRLDPTRPTVQRDFYRRGARLIRNR